MTNIKTLDEILEDYAFVVWANAGENDSVLKKIHNEAKQALNLYIEERERLARIDELKHLKQYDSFNKAYTTDTRCATLVDIRIKELKG